jgi:hypothetical protein
MFGAGAADALAARCGLAGLGLHAASNRHAVPRTVQPLPSAARHQSRADKASRRECARVVGRTGIAPSGKNGRAL